ncbi:hypothetical protein [Actinosynnema sp. NPDC020468]|uniref:baeRF2 domain-containing protein n=1 Tax=Actinosynnema sp. NPDC020468 TaxID=3154488 RepID=UPI0033E70F8D
MRTCGLHRVAEADGPFVSVYFDVTQHALLRWRAMRDQLEAHGAGEELLRPVDESVFADDAPPRGLAGRALVVCREGILVDRYLPVPPTGYTARLGALPYLLPLVELSEPLVPHVVVRVDEHGADLRGVDSTGRPVAVATVGARRPEQRLDPVELADVAREATSLVDRLGAPLLVLAGPLSCRRSLRVALPDRYHHLVVEVDGSPDREVPHLAGRADREGRRAVVRRFRDETTRMAGGAVHGVADVLAALEEGRVETVLLSEPLVGGREVDGVRVDELVPLRAVEQRADVVLVGGAVRLHEDVGALLVP